MSRLAQGFSNLSISSRLNAEEQKDLDLQKARWLAIPQEERDGRHFPIILPPDDTEQRQRRGICYEPLPTETSIRLIHLYPLKLPPVTGIDLYQPIVFSLKVVDLFDFPSYTALSYCWGDPQTLFPFRDLYRPPEQWAAPAFDIFLEDGTPISVRANLYAAMLSLRNLVTEECTGTSNYPAGVVCPCFDFWIDALCVDQQNDAEKSSQVSMMHRIYKEAAMVNVWLGGSDPASDIFSTIKYDLMALFLVKNGEYERLERMKIDDDTIYEQFVEEIPGFTPITMGQWMAVFAFFSRSWFSRAWVTQELAFARKALAICGTNLFDLDELVLIQQGLRFAGWDQQLQQLASYYIDEEPAIFDQITDSKLPTQNVPRLFKPTSASWNATGRLTGLIEIFSVAFGLGRTSEKLWEAGLSRHFRLPECHGYSLQEAMASFPFSRATDPSVNGAH